MSLKLLIDEDAQDKLLVKLLKNASHTVITVNEAGLMGQADPIILSYAKVNCLVLLTYNCDDFLELHDANPNHSGILAVYHNADRSKDMNFKAIVRAITNLETANIPLTNQFISLNHWNY